MVSLTQVSKYIPVLYYKGLKRTLPIKNNINGNSRLLVTPTFTSNIVTLPSHNKDRSCYLP